MPSPPPTTRRRRRRHPLFLPLLRLPHAVRPRGRDAGEDVLECEGEPQPRGRVALLAALLRRRVLPPERGRVAVEEEMSKSKCEIGVATERHTLPGYSKGSKKKCASGGVWPGIFLCAFLGTCQARGIFYVRSCYFFLRSCDPRLGQGFFMYVPGPYFPAFLGE